MLNVFIDTNIFLQFFSYSSEHLNKLEELVAHIKAGKLRLYLPEQVINEFNRNRESTLKSVLRNLESFNPTLNVPVVCRDFEEMKEIQKLLSEVLELKKKLIESITTQIKSKSLAADKLVTEIFSLVKKETTSDKTLSAAKLRYDTGNPPGKKDSYGDAIIWETLLEKVPESEDIYFICRDKDYVSAIDPNDMSAFLKEEWKTKKKSNVYYYELLSRFLKDKFADTKITDQEVKEEKTAAEQSSVTKSNALYSGRSRWQAYYDSLTGAALDARALEAIRELDNEFRNWATHAVVRPEVLENIRAFQEYYSKQLSSPEYIKAIEAINKEAQESLSFLAEHPEILKRIKDGDIPETTNHKDKRDRETENNK